MNRKEFVRSIIALSCINAAPAFSLTKSEQDVRKYHVSISPDYIVQNPEYIRAFKDAGIHKVWMVGFMYGYWYGKARLLRKAKHILEAAGIEAGIINVPLGHPGDSLGSLDETVPLTPPRHWQMKTDINGKKISGTYIFPLAVAENAGAIGQLRDDGFHDFFLDDDFRLATGPGQTGGNFDEEAKTHFLTLHNYTERDWQQILSNIRNRKLEPKLKSFIDFQCDLLSSGFKELKKASRNRVGNMVMYLGSEKAGIRLSDYSDMPFRVGESAFNDESFSEVKSKTNELFSVLFHSQFTTPDLAYSETTAFPHNKLSVNNLAAKLCISTLADVRNTMFMSGLTPFPVSYWNTLKPAMQKQSRLHKLIADVPVKAALKGYFGEHSRYVGNDNPYSLFFALGIPVDMSNTLSLEEEIVFMGDEDAQAFTEGKVPGFMSSQIIHRLEDKKYKGRFVPEKLEALFQWKNENIEKFKSFPFVKENVPVICRWYPAANLVLLWNLSEEKKTITVEYLAKLYTVSMEKLELTELQLG